MTGEALAVFAILGITVALFLSDRLRLDLVALMALLSLTLTGLITSAEAMAGFSDPVVLAVAGLFVVGEGLQQTGVARRLGQWLTRVGGKSEAANCSYDATGGHAFGADELHWNCGCVSSGRHQRRLDSGNQSFQIAAAPCHGVSVGRNADLDWNSAQSNR